MDAFWISTGVVALAEMGDKTQLLALVLAARFKRPWPIVWGILVATLLNHALAGAVGAVVMAWVGPEVMRWILGLSFVAMAVWVLVPDQLDDNDSDTTRHPWGVFAITVWVFFFAEMGDKTQIATIALGAQYTPLWAVVGGTTLGMMLANSPVAFWGEALTRRIPVRAMHVVAAVIFFGMGVGEGALGLALIGTAAGTMISRSWCQPVSPWARWRSSSTSRPIGRNTTKAGAS